MILQFVKRDPASKYTLWFTAATALAALFYKPAHPSSLLIAMAGPIYLTLFIRTLPHRRVTFFEAALPVSGHDLFLARLLSLLGLIWLPAAATSAALLITGNNPQTVLAIAVIATVLTLTTVVILSTRIKEFSAPAWLSVAGPALAGLGLAAALSFGRAIPIAAACGVATIAVGAIAWNSVPQGFQSAPAEVSAPRIKPGRRIPRSPGGR